MCGRLGDMTSVAIFLLEAVIVLLIMVAIVASCLKFLAMTIYGW
mgnify:CR=1 FL=1